MTVKQCVMSFVTCMCVHVYVYVCMHDILLYVSVSVINQFELTNLNGRHNLPAVRRP